MKSIMLLGFLSLFIFAAKDSQLSKPEAFKILNAMKTCGQVSCRIPFISPEISKLERTRISELFEFDPKGSELVPCEITFRKLDRNESCFQQKLLNERHSIYYFQQVGGSFKLKHLLNQ